MDGTFVVYQSTAAVKDENRYVHMHPIEGAPMLGMMLAAQGIIQIAWTVTDADGSCWIKVHWVRTIAPLNTVVFIQTCRE